MTKNPLLSDAADRWIGAEPKATVEDLRAWCADMNFRPISIRAEWWYYVRRNEHGFHFVEKLEGWRARQARASAAGKPIQWFHPGPEEANAIHKRVAQLIRNGVDWEDFRIMVERGLV